MSISPETVDGTLTARSNPYRWACGDEAGETGFRFQHGSTTHFLYCLVLADDLQPLRDYTDRMRRKLRMSAWEEFSFNHSSDVVRREFLAGLRSYEFAVRVFVVNKTILPTHFARIDRLSFYAFCLGELIARIPAGELGQTTLVLDRFGGAHSVIQAFQKQLRAAGRRGLVKKVITARSENEPAVQVADMIAGAVLRGAATGDYRFEAPIRDKIMLWEYAANKNPPS